MSVPCLDSATQLRAILETIGEGILTADREGVICMASAEAERLFGYARGELRGTQLATLIPGIELPDDGTLRELTGARKDGTTFPVELRFTGVEVEGQALFTGAVRDISLRRQRQQELERSLRSLEQRAGFEDLLARVSARFINVAVEEIGPGIDQALSEIGCFFQVDRCFIFVLSQQDGPLQDLAMRPNEAVLMAHEWCAEGVSPGLDNSGKPRMGEAPDPSEAAARAWFKDRIINQEVVALHSTKELPPELAPIRHRFEREGIRSRIVVPVVSEQQSIGILGFDVIRKQRSWDNDVVQLLKLAGQVFANAILRQRNALALQQAHEDLERKVDERTQQLEAKHAQLLQSEKLASLGQLVAGVAHEVNTPLGAIKSNNDTILRSLARLEGLLTTDALGDALHAKVDRLLSAAKELGQVNEDATERIARLVLSLRKFARLDQAEMDTVDLHQGLESTLTLLHHELKHHITVERDYGTLPEIRCYPNQLNQVFMNLLVNAVQAIEGKGSIRLTTRAQGDRVNIVLEDNGRGISSDDLPRIFDPGFTTKGVGVGTGLGLSIVHQIVEAHHGQIEIQSEPGKGTRVSLTFPVGSD